VLVKCMSRDWLAISTPELRYTSTRAPWEYERRSSLAGFHCQTVTTIQVAGPMRQAAPVRRGFLACRLAASEESGSAATLSRRLAVQIAGRARFRVGNDAAGASIVHSNVTVTRGTESEEPRRGRPQAGRPT
jgi:hypothetical protein